jgi:hypothetical protein
MSSMLLLPVPTFFCHLYPSSNELLMPFLTMVTIGHFSPTPTGSLLCWVRTLVLSCQLVTAVPGTLMSPPSQSPQFAMIHF